MDAWLLPTRAEAAAATAGFAELICGVAPRAGPQRQLQGEDFVANRPEPGRRRARTPSEPRRDDLDQQREGTRCDEGHLYSEEDQDDLKEGLVQVEVAWLRQARRQALVAQQLERENLELKHECDEIFHELRCSQVSVNVLEKEIQICRATSLAVRARCIQSIGCRKDEMGRVQSQRRRLSLRVCVGPAAAFRMKSNARHLVKAMRRAEDEAEQLDSSKLLMSPRASAGICAVDDIQLESWQQTRSSFILARSESRWLMEGIQAFRNDELAKSRKLFQKALWQAKAQKNLAIEGRASSNLAIFYACNDKTLDALNLFRRSLEVFRFLKDRKQESAAISNGIFYCLKLCLYDEALGLGLRKLSISHEPEEREEAQGWIERIHRIIGDPENYQSRRSWMSTSPGNDGDEMHSSKILDVAPPSKRSILSGKCSPSSHEIRNKLVTQRSPTGRLQTVDGKSVNQNEEKEQGDQHDDGNLNLDLRPLLFLRFL